MNKILVIDNCYPNEDNIYGNVFVHVRLKEYARDMDISVVGWNRKLPETFVYEGIKVRNFRDRNDFIDYVLAYNADLVIIHFLDYWMIRTIAMKLKKPLMIWVHGHEVVRWFRRLFNFEFSVDYLKYILRTEIQSVLWHQFIHYANGNRQIHFVFVSNWIKSIAEKDSNAKIDSFSIIPNPIDNNLFVYKQKPASFSKKILMIRSFATRVHANDVAIRGILAFSKYPEFKDFEFAIYGDGKYWDALTRPLQDFPNVHLHNHFIEHKYIPEVYDNFGVLLSVTRQDTQGVSMCEGMSSGLVPITTGIAGIPEYVSDHQTGLYAATPDQVAKALSELSNNPDLYKTLSKNAATSIREKCSLEKIAANEMQLINGLIKSM